MTCHFYYYIDYENITRSNSKKRKSLFRRMDKLSL